MSQISSGRCGGGGWTLNFSVISNDLTDDKIIRVFGSAVPTGIRGVLDIKVRNIPYIIPIIFQTLKPSNLESIFPGFLSICEYLWFPNATPESLVRSRSSPKFFCEKQADGYIRLTLTEETLENGEKKIYKYNYADFLPEMVDTVMCLLFLEYLKVNSFDTKMKLCLNDCKLIAQLTHIDFGFKLV